MPECIYYCEKEVLSLIGISHSTLWRLRKEGTFPQPKKIGTRKIVWLKSEINKYILN